MPRQLTAIMFADMVGYTALMQEDERKAKLLRDRQREVLEARVAEFDGEIIQYYGDGALCGFQSAIQAVECGIAVQIDLREEPPVPVRIGIHLGDVAFDKTGVYGDGVNIASRIESLSVPGAVLVSGKIADEVKNQPGISTEFLAEASLKNVKEPQRVYATTNDGLVVPGPRELKEWPKVRRKVGTGDRSWVRWAAGAVVIAGLVGAYALATDGSGRTGTDEVTSTPLTRESIAVLPFDYIGLPGENDYLGAFVATELSSALSFGPFLPVETSSIQRWMEGPEGRALAGRAGWERIALEADVGLVVSGSVTVEPNGDLSAAVRYFDPETGVTSEPIIQPGNVNEPGEVVIGLAIQISEERSGVDPSFLNDIRPSSFEAFQAFQAGNFEFRAGNYAEAARYFEEATGIDTSHALGHYRLSQAALWDWQWQKARDAVDEAWRFSSQLSDEHRELLQAWRDFLKDDPNSAENLYRHLYDEYPDSQEVLTGLGSVLAYYNSLRGRRSQEAVFYFEKVLAADPDYGEARYHVLDYAARERNESQFNRWVGGVNPNGPQALPFQAVEAFAFGTAGDQEEVLRRLATAETDHVVFAAGRVATGLHQLPGSERIGRLLLSPRGSNDHVPAGYALLAALGFAQGKWEEAELSLVRTAEFEEDWASEMRALFSFFLSDVAPGHISTDELLGLSDSIRAWQPEPSSVPSNATLFGPHALSHQEFRLYLLGLISGKTGDPEAASAYSDSLRAFGQRRTAETRALTAWLAQSVDAHAAYSTGDLTGAEGGLRSINYFPRFEFISASPFFSRALDRWLMGEVLVELDRPEEALAWYNTLSDGWGEFLFAAPAHLRQAQIYENLPEPHTAQAIAHYDEFIRLWENADDDLLYLVEEARNARDALAGGRN